MNLAFKAIYYATTSVRMSLILTCAFSVTDECKACAYINTETVLGKTTWVTEIICCKEMNQTPKVAFSLVPTPA